MNSGSSESDKLPTKLASGTKKRNDHTFFVHDLSSAFHFSLKQIAEIYAKINSPLGYGFFGRLEIRILVLMLQTANFANFLQEIRKYVKIARF